MEAEGVPLHLMDSPFQALPSIGMAQLLPAPTQLQQAPPCPSRTNLTLFVQATLSHSDHLQVTKLPLIHTDIAVAICNYAKTQIITLAKHH